VKKPPPDSVKRFNGLMRGLLAVPKAEIDEKAKEYARKRTRKRRQR
jgi:hypothetical protein